MRFFVWLPVAALLGLAAPVAQAAGGSVPINTSKRPGDVHIAFPTLSVPGSGSYWGSQEAIAHPVGDVNGDGRDDIGMSLSSTAGATTWVTFSPGPDLTSTNVADSTWSGLQITGATGAATGLTGVGDLNGDGYGDIAVSTSTAVYAIYGDPAPSSVDVRSLGSRGFTLTGLDVCRASGGGNIYTGVFWRGSSVVRIDRGLAVCGRDSIIAFRPPAAAAGKTFDVRQPDTVVGRIDVGAGVRPLFGAQSDGTLVIGWVTETTAHILAIPPPADGTELAIADAESSAQAAELDFPASYLEQVTPMSDMNGDGREDFAVSVVDAGGRRRFVAYEPQAGRRETVSAANSSAADDRFSGITDVGDQDGDGRPDLAYDPIIQLSATGAMISIDQPLPSCVPLAQLGVGGLVLCAREYKIADALPDYNGDGKRELIAIYADPLPIESDVQHTTWHLDVFPSATPPVLQPVDPPIQTGKRSMTTPATLYCVVPRLKKRSLAYAKRRLKGSCR